LNRMVGFLLVIYSKRFGRFPGKKGVFRASDLDATWPEETVVVPPAGPPNPKKLKKSKSKDESVQR